MVNFAKCSKNGITCLAW